MNFDIIGGAVTSFSLNHGIFGSDSNGNVELSMSTDSGLTYEVFDTIFVANKAMLERYTYSFSPSVPQYSDTIRFRINKSDMEGGRLNLDDIDIRGNFTYEAPSSPPTPISAQDDNLAMGNPSSANDDDPEDYLIVRPQFAMSYNDTKGSVNWVSWQVSSAWKGVHTIHTIHMIHTICTIHMIHTIHTHIHIMHMIRPRGEVRLLLQGCFATVHVLRSGQF